MSGPDEMGEAVDQAVVQVLREEIEALSERARELNRELAALEEGDWGDDDA
jgi:hypothetical protein